MEERTDWTLILITALFLLPAILLAAMGIVIAATSGGCP